MKMHTQDMGNGPKRYYLYILIWDPFLPFYFRSVIKIALRENAIFYDLKSEKLIEYQ